MCGGQVGDVRVWGDSPNRNGCEKKTARPVRQHCTDLGGLRHTAAHTRDA
jgi:hypothetical protein